MVSPLIGLLLVLLAGPAAAQSEESLEDAPVAAPSPESAPPALGLDRLLRVPIGTDYRVESLGGRDRAAWQQEFENVRREILELEQAIEHSQEKLRDSASDDWGFTPVGGGGPPSDPETLKLRADLRRDRESLETGQRRLRDLEVEASLAGVPDDWTRLDPKPEDSREASHSPRP